MKNRSIPFFALSTFVLSISIHAQPSQVEDLKNKLQQLERAMQELKTEISTIEQAEKPPGAVTALPQPPAPASCTTSSGSDGTTARENWCVKRQG